MRVTRSRELVAEGHKPAVVARVAQTSRQAIYRVPKTRPAVARRSGPPVGEVDAAIIEGALTIVSPGVSPQGGMLAPGAGARPIVQRERRRGHRSTSFAES